MLYALRHHCCLMKASLREKNSASNAACYLFFVKTTVFSLNAIYFHVASKEKPWLSLVSFFHLELPVQ